AARAGFFLCRAEQTAADAAVAPALIHPEKPDFSHATPRVTAETRIDTAVSISKKDDQPASIPNAGGREVEFVDLLLEELQIFGRSVLGHHNGCPILRWNDRMARGVFRLTREELQRGLQQVRQLRVRRDSLRIQTRYIQRHSDRRVFDHTR